MVSFILFIIILGTIVLIHELGHFLFSKLFGVYVYEYSIGMGKKIWSKKPKNSETEYCLRLIPIGGFVRLAGEEGEDGDATVPEDRKLYKKGFIQRLLIFFMGPGFNLVLAFIVLLITCSFFGGNLTTVELDNITSDYPAYQAGLRDGDILLAVDGQKVSTWTQARLKIATTKQGSSIKFKIKDTSGNIKSIVVSPKKEKNKSGEVSYIYGVGCKVENYKGLGDSFKYAFMETREILLSMFDTLKYLFTGKLGVNDLSGPVGVYEVVDEQAQFGLSNLFYLLAYLSINVGVINLIPFPAFDGGHILFLIIEKIRRKPISPNVEATITGIGFVCLMILMFYVTCHDVLNLIN
jgi:regulator of sigma E protease